MPAPRTDDRPDAIPIPWGDGQAIGGPVAGRSDGRTPARLTIYGLVPRQPGTPAGDYADSLVVTLSF